MNPLSTPLQYLISSLIYLTSCLFLTYVIYENVSILNRTTSLQLLTTLLLSLFLRVIWMVSKFYSEDEDIAYAIISRSSTLLQFTVITMLVKSWYSTVKPLNVNYFRLWSILCNLTIYVLILGTTRAATSPTATDDAMNNLNTVLLVLLNVILLALTNTYGRRFAKTVDEALILDDTDRDNSDEGSHSSTRASSMSSISSQSHSLRIPISPYENTSTSSTDFTLPPPSPLHHSTKYRNKLTLSKDKVTSMTQVFTVCFLLRIASLSLTPLTTNVIFTTFTYPLLYYHVPELIPAGVIGWYFLADKNARGLKVWLYGWKNGEVGRKGGKKRIVRGGSIV